MPPYRRAAAPACAALIAGLIALPLPAHATQAWIATSSEKVLPGAAARPLAAPALQAARNEFEAFQIALVGPLSGVTATATAFTGPGTLAAPRLYREALITLQNASGPDGATGAWPDALLPDVDELVGEKRNAFPFDVPAGETRVLWVEAFVPADAAAGDYAAQVVVSAAGQPDLTVPVGLTVWPFALPSTASLASNFGLYYGDLPRAHGVSGDAFSTLRARYAQLGLDHRISVSSFDDGGGNDLTHFTRFYGPLVDGTAPTRLAGAKVTSVQYTGSADSAGHATWAAFFKQQGWFDRLFDYTCDEPDSARCTWSDLQARYAMVKAGDPAFRSLTTTDVQSATQNGALGEVDILTPVVNYMDDKSGSAWAGAQRSAYDGFLANGSKTLWMYQSCMSHGCSGTSPYFAGWASYAIDASAIRNRAMEWLSFLFGVSGELYYETTQAYDYADGRDPWTNQWAYGGNGDGTLFYPGTPAAVGGQTDIPVASIRLKMIREGMEDHEYLKLLSDVGDPTLAQALAAQLFPNPWTQPSVDQLFAAREQIAFRIVQLTGGGSAAGAAAANTTAASGSGSGSTAGTATAPLTHSATSTSSGGASPMVGSGCSGGSGGGVLALLGLAASLGARRRRRLSTTRSA
ncbi:MAG TPA: DUF4091 domain-containing protein [Anaeromyxobacteraceae bacterium]